MSNHRTVIIVRDGASPLHFLRCAAPCSAEGWCMPVHPGKPEGQRYCYLGGGKDAAAARWLADLRGYTVVEAGR